ncbi:MAG: hypothetical protein KDD64_15980, partial [Bdellovibrionales bacterium]|nr:hypothetical protein [Bdellovibrionales bacterium]
RSAGPNGLTAVAVSKDLLDTARQQNQDLDRLLASIQQESLRNRMSEGAREMVRRVRDANIAGLGVRAGIDMVTRKEDNLFRKLNPAEVSYHQPSRKGGGDNKERPKNRQMWNVINQVSQVWFAASENEIFDAAVVIANQNTKEGRHPAHVARLNLTQFEAKMEQMLTEAYESATPKFYAALGNAIDTGEVRPGDRDVELALNRSLHVRWLKALLTTDREDDVEPSSVDLRDFDERITTALESGYGMESAAGLPAALELVDREIETLFQRAIELQLPELKLIQIRQLRNCIDLTRDDYEVQPADNSMTRDAAELAAKLDAGAKSAVGGPFYASGRVQRVVLDLISSQRAKVLPFSGDKHEDALAVVGREFLRHPVDPNQLKSGVCVDLIAPYGDLPRSMIIPVDASVEEPVEGVEPASSEAYVVFTALGEGRQFSQVTALTNYKDQQGRRISAPAFVFARERISSEKRIELTLTEVLEREAERADKQEIFGALRNVAQMETSIIGFRHPQLYAAGLGADRAVALEGGYPSVSLGRFHVVYQRHPDGEVRRLLIPSVGGAGLYGPSMGEFLQVVNEHPLVPRRCPDDFFYALAGGFPGTADISAFVKNRWKGLPKNAKIGSTIMPTEAIVDEHGNVVPMATLLDLTTGIGGAVQRARDRFVQSLMDLKVYATSRHGHIRNPGLELNSVINDVYMRNGASSVDVESLYMVRAAREIPNGTTTLMLLNADNPNLAIADEYYAWALGGPIEESPRTSPQVLVAIADGIDLSHEFRKVEPQP